MRADEILIPEPCNEDWDVMDREERGRYCHHCAHSVADLSSMTEPEARAFLAEREGEKLCISMVVRGNRVVHRDDPIPPRALLRRTSQALHRFAPSALAGALALLGASACTPHGEPEVLEFEDAEATSVGFDEPMVIPVADGPPSTPMQQEPCEPQGDANKPAIKHKWPRVKGERPVRKTGKKVSRHDIDELVVGYGT